MAELGHPESLAATAMVAFRIVAAEGASLSMGPIVAHDPSQGCWASLVSADKLRYVSTQGPTLAAALLDLVLQWGQP